MTKKEKLLQVLESKLLIPGDRLVTVIGHRFGAQIEQLRNEGWKIRSKPVAKGRWSYQLLGKDTSLIAKRQHDPKCRTCGRKFSNTSYIYLDEK